jgi:hypothetical protein
MVVAYGANAKEAGLDRDRVRVTRINKITVKWWTVKMLH